MKPGPKKRFNDRICVSLGKGQKRGLQKLAGGKEASVADLVRRAVDKTYGRSIRGGAA